MQIIHAKQCLTQNGWQSDIQIDVDSDGHIAAIGETSAQPTSCVELALPAPVNLHSHAFQRAMAGLTEARGPDPRDSFWTWRRLMYRFLDRLSPDDIAAISAQVFLEMLEAGYAGVAEFHYLHHDVGGGVYANLAELSEQVVSAAQQVGIGLTLLPVYYQFGGCDQRALEGGQRRFGNDPNRFARLHQDAARAIQNACEDYTIGIAPHSLRAVNQGGLRDVLSLASDRPIHMHLAEQVAEIEEVQTHWGARPTEWLLANHDIDRKWCLIHCTQMDGRETRSLAQSGAVAGLCPITESNLGDGIFNGTEFLTAGGTVGFGSDSNVHIALFNELSTLEYSQRLRDRSRAALARSDASTGRVLFDQACRGGAQAAGRASGVLAPGQLADIVGMNTTNPWLCGLQGDMLLDALIFGGHGGQCVQDVWSAGRHLVQNGRHIERETVAQNYMQTMTKLTRAL